MSLMASMTDESGRLVGFRCHDGSLLGVRLCGASVELRCRRVDETEVLVVLNGVGSFAMDRFLEGNIVDSAYLWPVAQAPKLQRQGAVAAFSCEEQFFDRRNDVSRKNLFVLECSYGATIFALVSNIDIVDS